MKDRDYTLVIDKVAVCPLPISKVVEVDGK